MVDLQTGTIIPSTTPVIWLPPWIASDQNPVPWTTIWQIPGVWDINQFVTDMSNGQVQISVADRAAIAKFLAAQKAAEEDAQKAATKESMFFKWLASFGKTDAVPTPKKQEFEAYRAEKVDTIAENVKHIVTNYIPWQQEWTMAGKIVDITLGPIALWYNLLDYLWRTGSDKKAEISQQGKTAAEINTFYDKKISDLKNIEANTNIKQTLQTNIDLASDTVWISPLRTQLEDKQKEVIPYNDARNLYYASAEVLAKKYKENDYKLATAHEAGSAELITQANTERQQLDVEELKIRIKLAEWTDVVWSSQVEIFDSLRKTWNKPEMTDEQIMATVNKKEIAQLAITERLVDEYHQIETDYNIKSDTNISEISINSRRKTTDDAGIIATDTFWNEIRNITSKDNVAVLTWAKKNDKESQIRIGFSMLNTLNNDIFVKSEVLKYAEWEAKTMWLKEFRDILSTEEYDLMKNTILGISTQDKYYDDKWNFKSTLFKTDLLNTEAAAAFWQKFWDIFQANNLERRLINGREQLAEWDIFGAAATGLGWEIAKIKDMPGIWLNWYLEKATDITGQPGVLALINPYSVLETGLSKTGSPMKKLNESIFWKSYSHADLLDDFASEITAWDITHQQNIMGTIADTTRMIFHKVNADPAGTIMAVAPLFMGNVFSPATSVTNTIMSMKNISSIRTLWTLYNVGLGAVEWAAWQISFEQLNATEKSEPLMYALNVIPAIFQSFKFFRNSAKFRPDVQAVVNTAKNWFIAQWLKWKKLEEAMSAFVQKEWWPVIWWEVNPKTIADEYKKFVDEGLDITTDAVKREERVTKLPKDTIANYMYLWAGGEVVFDTKSFAQQLETTLSKNVWNINDYAVQLQTQALNQMVTEWRLQKSEIKLVLEWFKKDMPELYTQTALQFTKWGIVDESKLLAKFIEMNQNTTQKMVNYWLAKLYDFTAKTTGMTSEIIKKAKEVDGFIATAIKIATPEQMKVLTTAQQLSRDVFSKMSTIPLAYIKGMGPEKIAPIQKQFDNLMGMLNGVSGISTQKLWTNLESLIKLPKEVLDLQWTTNAQKLAQLFSEKTPENLLNKYWVKIYSAADFTTANNKFLQKTLGRNEFKRLSDIMNTIGDINNVSIYQLPNEYKVLLGDIKWFTTFVQNGNKKQLIVGMMGWLVDIASDTTKLAKNIDYIKTVTHEMGHNIMLSLVPEVRVQIINAAKKLFYDVGITETEQWHAMIEGIVIKLLPNASKDRILFLKWIKDEKIFYEELSADIMSDALQTRVFWREWDIERIGDQMYDLAKKWDLDWIIIKNDNEFEVVADRFWTSMVWVSRAMWKTSDVEQIRNTMYFLADSIVWWQRMRTAGGNGIKGGKAIEELKILGFLTKWGEEINSKVFNSADKLRSWFDSFGTKWIDYTETFTYWDGEVFRWSIQKISKETEAVPVQESLFYATKTKATKSAYGIVWWRVSTLKEGITSFDIAKVYSEWIVRWMVRDTAISSEKLWQTLSLNYLESLPMKNILEWASATEVKKFNDAVQFAQSKHNIAVRNIQLFYTAWKIDLTKTVDGKSFFETLKNVGTRITKQWFVEFAGQDLMKFLNISDEATYQKILAGYMDTMIKDYDPKVVTKITAVFDELKLQGKTFWERYAEFSKIVQWTIVKAALDGWVDVNYAKDITSRLFVWGPWYLSMLSKNSKEIIAAPLDFINDLARGLTKKNAYRTKNVYHSEEYAKILKNIWLKWTEASALNMVENFWKEIGFSKWAIEYQSYTKEFYNLLSARTEDYIINSLQKQWLKELSIDSNNFVEYINKIASKSSLYDDVIRSKFQKLGILDDLDMRKIINADGIESIIAGYKEEMLASKSKIVTRIWETWYDNAVKYIDDILKDGISAKDSELLLSSYQAKFDAYTEGLTAEKYFADIVNVKETHNLWKKNLDAFQSAILGTTSKEYKMAVSTAMWPEWTAAIDSLLGVVTDYNLMSKEIASEWFQGAFNKIFENTMLKPFFNVEWKGFEFIAKPLLGLKWTVKYDVQFADVQNLGKKMWLNGLIGRLTNTATIAEKDKDLSNIVMNASENMNKTQKIFKDSALEKYLIKIGEQKAVDYWSISTKTFVNTFVKQMWKFAKGKNWLTFEWLWSDILDRYIKRNFNKKAIYKALSVQWGDVEEYGLLVDSYVDLISRRWYNWLWLFDESVIKYIDDVPQYAWWLAKQLKSIGAAFDATKRWWWAGSKWMKEADKMMWLWGAWVGMKDYEIKKLADKAEIYFHGMFDNFLYNTMSKSDVTTNVFDKMLRGFKVKIGDRTIKLGLKQMEEFAANAQYALFYNVFAAGAGISAGTQQILSNKFHLMWKIAWELWSTRIDNIGEFVDIVNDILPYDVIKTIRPEFTESARSAGKTINSAMTMTSTLTWADVALQKEVERYVFTSALLQRGYTAQWAKSMIDWLSIIQKSFEAKWYAKYFAGDASKGFEHFLMRNENTIMKWVSYKIEKEVEVWLITRVEWNKLLQDIAWYKAELSPIREVIEDARIKTMTFYQMGDKPELLQNFIGWWAGAANMRFMNWASRKTGEYAYSMSEALIKKNWVAGAKIMSQLTTEATMAMKLSMGLNGISEWDPIGWGVNKEKIFSSVFLPYTLMSMMTFKMLPLIWDTIMGVANNIWYDKTTTAIEDRLDKQWASRAKSMQADINNVLTTGKWRFGASMVYRATQWARIFNGLWELTDKWDRDVAYSTAFSSIPFIRDIAEIVANVMQSRVSKFDTMTIGWVNRDYVNTSSTDSFISYLMNAKVAKNILKADRLVSSFYDMSNSSDDQWFAPSFSILPFSRDRRFALRAWDKYQKDKWLWDLINGGTSVGDLLVELDQMSTDATLNKNFDSMWFDSETVMTNIDSASSSDSLDVFNDETLTEWQKADISGYMKPKSSKVWNAIMGMVKMDGWVEEKGMYFAGEWITAQQVAANKVKYEEIKNKISSAITANPLLAKAAAFDEKTRTDEINDGLNTFGQQTRIAVIMDGMAKANRAIHKEELMKTMSKEIWRQNSKSKAILDNISANDNEYKLSLLKNNYNTLLQGNRNIGKNLQVMYFNTDPAKPLVKQLSENVGLWTIVIPNIIKKTVEAQWIASLWTDNVFATLNRQMWYNLWSIKDDAWKEKFIKNMFEYKAAVLDYATNFGDKMEGTNVKVWIIASDIPHLDFIKQKSPELYKLIEPEVKEYLDRMTVSEPLTDEAILANIKSDIFKTTGTGKWKHSAPAMKLLAEKLNKFSDFKTDFYRYVLKKEPLEQITYKFDGGAKIIPLRQSAIEARPPKAEYNFIKITQPESLKTPDITVETIKTIRSSSKYTGKAIKWSKIYTVKTSRWAKK